MADLRGLPAAVSSRVSPLVEQVFVSSARAAEEIERLQVAYLPLPAVLSVFADDRFFLAARPFGWLYYQDSDMIVGADNGLVVSPLHYTREEVVQLVMLDVAPRDRRLQALLVLPWRVGFAMGWLSGVVGAST